MPFITLYLLKEIDIDYFLVAGPQMFSRLSRECFQVTPVPHCYQGGEQVGTVYAERLYAFGS